MTHTKQGDRRTIAAANEILAGGSTKGWLARVLPFLEPALLASVAYVDMSRRALLLTLASFRPT